MDENAQRKRSVVVALFLSCLCLIASFGLQIQTKNTLQSLAAASVTAQQTGQTNPTTGQASALETEAVLAQIQDTDPVSEKVAVANQANTAKAIKEPTPTATEKQTEVSPILLANTNTKKSTARTVPMRKTSKQKTARKSVGRNCPHTSKTAIRFADIVRGVPNEVCRSEKTARTPHAQYG